MIEFDPRFNGIRVRGGFDDIPVAFTEAELNNVYYSLTAKRLDEYLILESPSFEDVDNFYNPGVELIGMILEAIAIAKFSQAERKMLVMSKVMNRYLKGNEENIEALLPVIGKPKRSGNFAYVTVQVPFSDGQTVSMVFHSPEGDKKKIGPNDALIAFRWLLNKRDITQVVAPEAGKEVSIQSIGKRITQLVVKNHARFVTTQKAAKEETERLESLTSSVQETETVNQEMAGQVVEVEEKAEKMDADIVNTEKKIGNQQEKNAQLEADIAVLKAQKMAQSVGGDGSSNDPTPEQTKDNRNIPPIFKGKDGLIMLGRASKTGEPGLMQYASITQAVKRKERLRKEGYEVHVTARHPFNVVFDKPEQVGVATDDAPEAPQPDEPTADEGQTIRKDPVFNPQLMPAEVRTALKKVTIQPVIFEETSIFESANRAPKDIRKGRHGQLIMQSKKKIEGAKERIWKKDGQYFVAIDPQAENAKEIIDDNRKKKAKLVVAVSREEAQGWMDKVGASYTDDTFTEDFAKQFSGLTYPEFLEKIGKAETGEMTDIELMADFTDLMKQVEAGRVAHFNMDGVESSGVIVAYDYNVQDKGKPRYPITIISQDGSDATISADYLVSVTDQENNGGPDAGKPSITKEKFAQKLIENIKLGKQDKGKVLANLQKNLSLSEHTIAVVPKDKAEPGFFTMREDAIERNKYAIEQINAAFDVDPIAAKLEPPEIKDVAQNEVIQKAIREGGNTIFIGAEKVVVEALVKKGIFKFEEGSNEPSIYRDKKYGAGQWMAATIIEGGEELLNEGDRVAFKMVVGGGYDMGSDEDPGSSVHTGGKKVERTGVVSSIKFGDVTVQGDNGKQYSMNRKISQNKFPASDVRKIDKVDPAEVGLDEATYNSEIEKLKGQLLDLGFTQKKDNSFSLRYVWEMDSRPLVREISVNYFFDESNGNVVINAGGNIFKAKSKATTGNVVQKAILAVQKKLDGVETVEQWKVKYADVVSRFRVGDTYKLSRKGFVSDSFDIDSYMGGYKVTNLEQLDVGGSLLHTIEFQSDSGTMNVRYDRLQENLDKKYLVPEGQTSAIPDSAQEHIDTLNEIIAGSFDDNPDELEAKLDEAAEALEKLGLMETHNDLLMQAGNKAAEIAVEKTKNI